LITPEIEPRLYGCFADVARRRGCDVLAIGGTENHVHLLLALPATIRPCDLIRELKAGSSRLIQETLKPDTWFDWQNNYAAIAVSPSHRKRIVPTSTARNNITPMAPHTNSTNSTKPIQTICPKDNPPKARSER